MTFPWLTLIVAVPMAGAIAASRNRDRDAGRRVAAAAAVTQLALSLLVPALNWREGVGYFVEEDFRVPGLSALGVHWHFGVDGIAAAFLPLIALLASGVILAGPRSRLDPGYIGAVLLTAAGGAGLVMSADLGLLGVMWVASLLPNFWMLQRHPDAFIRDELRRSYSLYLLAGALPLLSAIVILGLHGLGAGLGEPLSLSGLAARPIPADQQGLLFTLIAASVLTRMAVFPVHSWLPLHIEHGPLGIGVMTIGSHLSVYVLARMIPVLPFAADQYMPFLSYAAVGSGLFGAVLAVVQTNLRRAIAYLVVSQSSLMLLGLSSMTEPSVQGALVQAVASGAAVSGLLLLVWALESRTGTADFRRFGGFGQVMPRMATVFFVFSAAAVGFPGSLMFVGEDLIVHGVLDEHPVVAAVVLISMASNGYMLIRAFSRIFLGPSMDARDALDPSLLGGRSESLHDMLGRERAVAAAFALVIIGGGIHPQPLITLSHDAALALALHHERHEPAEAEDHEGEGHHPEGH